MVSSTSEAGRRLRRQQIDGQCCNRDSTDDPCVHDAVHGEGVGRVRSCHRPISHTATWSSVGRCTAETKSGSDPLPSYWPAKDLGPSSRGPTKCSAGSFKTRQFGASGRDFAHQFRILSVCHSRWKHGTGFSVRVALPCLALHFIMQFDPLKSHSLRNSQVSVVTMLGS